MTYLPIPPGLFGRDHLSLLRYVETRVVDHAGLLDWRHLRVRGPRHPLGQLGRTRLADGSHAFEGHDDLHCLQDLSAAGFLSFVEQDHANQDETVLLVVLSRKGWAAAQYLRMARAGHVTTNGDRLTVDALDDHYSALLDRADPTDTELDRFHYDGKHAHLLRVFGEQEWTTDSDRAPWAQGGGAVARDYLLRRGLVERNSNPPPGREGFPELRLTAVGRAVLAELVLFRRIAAATFSAPPPETTPTAADVAEDQVDPS